MSAPDQFIAWCKQEQASLQQQLELLEASKVLTGEDRGSGWVNTSAESKTRVKERLRGAGVTFDRNWICNRFETG